MTLCNLVTVFAATKSVTIEIALYINKKIPAAPSLTDHRVIYYLHIVTFKIEAITYVIGEIDHRLLGCLKLQTISNL